MWSSVLLALLSVQLTSADLVVDVTSGRVRAVYHIQTPADSITFSAARVSGDLTIAGDFGPVLRGMGRYAVTRPAGLGGATRVELRYTVPPGSSRIPIFVPDVPTEAARGAVNIRLTGIPEDARERDGFPRMVRADDGSVVARPANVPSFVIVPPVGETLGINRLADTFVVLLLIGSTGYWFMRRVRA